MLRSNKDKQTAFEFVSLEHLVPQDHMLRKVDQYVDFSFILEKVRAIIPNVARRFLEAYLNFRNPSSKQGLIQKMNVLFTNDTDRFLVFKFTNEYSHNDQVNNRTFYLPEIDECKQVVELIFKCLEEVDKLHFDALVENTD